MSNETTNQYNLCTMSPEDRAAKAATHAATKTLCAFTAGVALLMLLFSLGTGSIGYAGIWFCALLPNIGGFMAHYHLEQVHLQSKLN